MNERGVSRITVIFLIVALMVVVAIGFSSIMDDRGGVSSVKQLTPKEIEESNNDVYVVATMKDEIKTNSAWCATFQLVWNDLQDEFVGGKVEFNESVPMADNLNLQEFKEEDISDEYYYKKWGAMTPSLKEEIEREIKAKFNENSDILDRFDWEERGERYFFYAMLRRNFEFEKEFKILDKKNFKDIENVEYFGVKSGENSVYEKQVDVLYYNDENDFAVRLDTKNGDQVILARRIEANNFEEIYKEINERTDKFEGNKKLANVDTLSIPNLNMDLFREYREIIGKPFKTKDGDSAEIEKALQTIQMELNNKGGSIKSEAAMSVTKGIAFTQDEPRNFDFNNDFVIFLKEESKELPYFAAQICNLNLFLKK